MTISKHRGYFRRIPRSSARDFFLMTNQKREKPPADATRVEAVAMAEMPPPDRGSLGISSPQISQGLPSLP